MASISSLVPYRHFSITVSPPCSTHYYTATSVPDNLSRWPSNDTLPIISRLEVELCADCSMVIFIFGGTGIPIALQNSSQFRRIATCPYCNASFNSNKFVVYHRYRVCWACDRLFIWNPRKDCGYCGYRFDGSDNFVWRMRCGYLKFDVEMDSLVEMWGRQNREVLKKCYIGGGVRACVDVEDPYAGKGVACRWCGHGQRMTWGYLKRAHKTECLLRAAK